MFDHSLTVYHSYMYTGKWMCVSKECKITSFAHMRNLMMFVYISYSVYWSVYLKFDVIQQLSRAHPYLYNKRVCGSSTLCLPSPQCSISVEFEPIWLEQWVISRLDKNRIATFNTIYHAHRLLHSGIHAHTWLPINHLPEAALREE